MRLMNWNIEHMNSWWEGGDADPAVLKDSVQGGTFFPSVADVLSLATRVGNVINAVDPDVITIQEAAGEPEMRHFFEDFVDGDWTFLRGSGGGQALIVAAKLNGIVSGIEDGPTEVGGVDLTAQIMADTNADLVPEGENFARKPQVVNLTAHGQELRLINNHLKSKFVRDGEARFNAGGEQQLGFFADALEVRRRISAEAFRIREYLNAVFEDSANALVIVTGDLNDGAGADYFEQNFLTHSVVDRVFGSVFFPQRQLSHVLFHGGSTDFTAKFFDFIADEERELVLDHIGLSQAINENWTWTGRVAVAEYEAEVIDDPELFERDQAPSDHRPVVADLTPN